MADLIELRDDLGAGFWPGADMHDRLGSDRRGELAYGAFNGSLDAAKALHEAVLPSFFWNLGHLDQPSLGYVATVAQGHFADSPSWRGFGMAPARAWLLAILEALIAQEKADD